MRLYVPATSRLLTVLDRKGVIGPAPITAFAVTPGLREWYLDEDIEELEYAASLEAARASLRLIGTEAAAISRRIVVAADVADGLVSVRDDLDRGVVIVAAEIPLAWCASVHVDDLDAVPTVEVAAPLVDAADLGDPHAQEKVDDADGYELAWYATQEIGAILAQFDGPQPDN